MYTKGIYIDGVYFDVPLVSIKRTGNPLFKWFERNEAGEANGELVGVYINYNCNFGVIDDTQTYEALWAKLNEPVIFHNIQMPSNNGFYAFSAYITSVSDNIRKIHSNNVEYDELTCEFIAQRPARVPEQSTQQGDDNNITECEIKFELIDTTIKEDGVWTSSQADLNNCDLSLLWAGGLNTDTFPHMAYRDSDIPDRLKNLEHNWIGINSDDYSSQYDTFKTGFYNNNVSQSDGTFTDPLMLTLTCTKEHTISSIYMDFGAIYPSRIRIELDDTPYFYNVQSREFVANLNASFRVLQVYCENTAPYSFFKLNRIYIGEPYYFDKETLKTCEMNIKHDPTLDTLPISTCNFTVANPGGVFNTGLIKFYQALKIGQEADVWEKVNGTKYHLGKWYYDGFTVQDDIITINLVDMIGKMDRIPSPHFYKTDTKTEAVQKLMNKAKIPLEDYYDNYVSNPPKTHFEGDFSSCRDALNNMIKFGICGYHPYNRIIGDKLLCSLEYGAYHTNTVIVDVGKVLYRKFGYPSQIYKEVSVQGTADLYRGPEGNVDYVERYTHKETKEIGQDYVGSCDDEKIINMMDYKGFPPEPSGSVYPDFSRAEREYNTFLENRAQALSNYYKNYGLTYETQIALPPPKRLPDASVYVTGYRLSGSLYAQGGTGEQTNLIDGYMEEMDIDLTGGFLWTIRGRIET